MNPVMIIGHRGAMANAPENSIESFEMAMEQGAHMIEMDVCLSKDGGVLVMHDDTLDRTTDG
ncbi:MAG: glycerophosphodiester phosphodiesterase, partial [Thermoplasmata archaeon]|nr:glycerophosphodiester phosphodiesterase [Thermoplasmata archaeon]